MNTKCTSMMTKMEPTKKNRLILFSLLIILNIILRIPSIPHEKGTDSFFIHALSNSLTNFGSANWWAHWLSVFGLYPYSYASAIPFSISGMAQTTGLTGIQMENTILLYSIFLGLFSIFVAYVFAGTIYDDFLFKYLMALLFSISQGVMIFSTWELSSRGPFIIFLPLFIFIILKKIYCVKTIILLGLLGLFLVSVHHFFWLLIPLIAIFTALKISYMLNPIWKKAGWIKVDYLNYIYVVSFIVIFLYPFLSHSMITAGSRYGWLINMFIINTRYTGPVIVFLFAGMIYSFLKTNKKFEEWYILLALLAFIPFTYNQTYGQYATLLLLIFYINVAFRNILSINKKEKRKVTILVISLSLLLFTSFSAFYNHGRTSNNIEWYLDENTYQTGLWINDNIDNDEHIISKSLNRYTIRTIALQSNASSMIIGGPLGLANNQIEKQFIYDNLIKLPMDSPKYYADGPYTVDERDIYRDVEWYLNYKDIKIIKDRYNCDYLLQYSGLPKPPGFEEKNTGIIYTSGILEVCSMENI